MKKKTLRMLSLMVTMALLMTALPATAEETENGQIIIKISDARFVVSGIELFAYEIATGDYGHWTPVKALTGLEFPKSEDDSAWADETLKLVKAKVNELGRPRTATTDNNGTAVFSKLTHGVYYITGGNIADPNLTIRPMLLAVPNKRNDTRIVANSKHEYKSDFPTPPPGKHYEPIDEYETALGLGNIQMHVGVCFE